MRKIILAAALSLTLAPAVLLTGCSDTQVIAVNKTLDKYDHGLDNFQTIIARVDQSAAKTDATLGPYCSAAEETGTNLAQIVKGNDQVLTALNTVSSALSSWCTSRPKDTASAVVALTKAIGAGQAVLHGG